jgi:two-component system, NtrC family, response regulator GlrR
MKNRTPPVTASLAFGLKVIAASNGKTRKNGKITENGSHPQAAPAGNPRILIVDHDPASSRLMMIRLGAADYEVESASNAQAAIGACARFRPNLVITALRMEHMDGLGLLRELKGRWPGMSVIILTAHGSIPEAVEATQCGAFGFLVKPIEKSELLGQVQRAIKASNFAHAKADWRSQIVSRSQLMEDRLAQANRIASSDAPVVLTGESGTGKELFARAIHAASVRREQPFISVMCRSQAKESLESQLFGNPEDALSGVGASGGGGAFKAARGGTLMLAEIGDLPLSLQIRLAEALREDQSGRAGVRLMCTSSRDLHGLVNIGQFNNDLYYRISVLPIEVPPLGRRREDIPLLVASFLEQATENGGSAKIYSPKAIRLLATADWPGNVRQLFELVKQNIALSEGEVMTEEFVHQSLGGDSTRVPSYDDARNTFAREYLIRNLQSTSGNVSKSARFAKRNRTDFYKLLSRYRLEPDEFKDAASESGKK